MTIALIHRARRRGFTLIELMVVIAIIIALASITLLFLPKREVRLASQGADQLQTFIASARSRALRDHAPRGVRFIPDPANASKYREAQLIEVPEPFAPNVPLAIPQATAIAVAQNYNVPTNVTIQENIATDVFIGDMLEILQGAGSIHRITNIQQIGPNASRVTLQTTPPTVATAPLTISSNYRFIRQPRPLMGEKAFQLPSTVFVMANSPVANVAPGSQNIPSSLTGGFHEIVFAPSGQVFHATAGRIILWVSDDNNVSKPTLLTVYSHTGGVAAHPVGPAGAEYLFTQDGRSSGQ